MPNITLAGQIDAVQQQRQELVIKEGILMEKALRSDNPNDVIKAAKTWKDIQERQQSNAKSFLIDPFDALANVGYKDKASSITFDTLKNMSRVPIIKSIIGARIEQIAAFSEPQPDKYSPGFVIRKKQFGNKKVKSSPGDDKTIRVLTDFVLNCGIDSNSWHGDTFDSFLRKITQDSFTYDQMTFEVVRNRKGIPIEFFATDASTYRIASSLDDDNYAVRDRDQIQGYYPSYVQIFDGTPQVEFYPWELCFGVRNPSTSIYNNGYGQSELEDLVNIVTSMLWSDEYNRSFFSKGSAPKGIIRVKGGVNETKLAEFRQNWLSMIAGVGNAWKTPILNAEEMDWIDLQKNNRDMEFSEYQKYLIQVACAVFKMDPNEIGFDVNSGKAPLMEGSKEANLQYSKDKGLKPTLKFIEHRINKYIINPINPDYELKFMGLETETASTELDADIKRGQNFMTVNELREKEGMDPLEDGDYVNSTFFFQNAQMGMQGDPDSNNAVGRGEDDTEKAEDSPFYKGLNEFFEQTMTK